MSLNHDLAELFSTMADVMDIKGENAFKVLAFRKVARVLKDSTLDVRRLVEEGRLDEVEGVGKSSRRIIEEFVRTGKSGDFDSLVAEVPSGLLPLLKVEGLGPKTIALLWKERKIESEEDLRKAIESGLLDGLKGIGEKKIAAIRHGLDARNRAAGRTGLAPALVLADEIVRRVIEMEGVAEAQVAGSLRRRRETIGDIDIIAALKRGAKGAEVAGAFARLPLVERVIACGTTKASVVAMGGVQVDLRIVPRQCFGAALMYFTGSKEHNVRLRSLAARRGWTLNEWGLYEAEAYEKAEKSVGEPPRLASLAGADEAGVYRKLGMGFIEPELREDRGEVEAALDGRLPDLVRIEDYRGDLHTHTTASDGQSTLEQMVEAALERGYRFLAITDHSRSSAVANGLDVPGLMKHIEAIRRVQDRYRDITLLAGSEVDILADGRLDYEDDVLAELDIVVASPHVALKQDARKATDRMLRAIDNRYVNIIGHPTGRLIGGRDGLPLEMGEVVKAAARAGVALEINAGWPRLDLSDVNARTAVEAGAMLAIDTDAHATDQLDQLRLGIAVARRAWAGKDRVVNCLDLPALRRFLTRRR